MSQVNILDAIAHTPMGPQCHGRLITGVDFIDKVYSISPGKVTFVNAPASLLDMFFYNLLTVNSGFMGQKVAVIECGNYFSPYILAEATRSSNHFQSQVMKNVMITRPFTIYQLNTLFEEKIPAVLDRERPTALILSHFVELFEKDDDSQTLINRILGDMKYTASHYNIPIIITNRTRFGGWLYLSAISEEADTILSLRNIPRGMQMHIQKDPYREETKIDRIIPDEPPQQATMDLFIEA